jgi:chromate transporter
MSGTTPPSDPPPPTAPATPPNLAQLFLAFATIAVCGFGGVLAWSRRMLVEQRQWMTPAEFNDAYALCQVLPGPNIVNLAVVFGRRIRGVPGAVVALVGLIGPPFLIVTFFGFLYARFGEIAALQRMFLAVAAAAAGLIIGTAAKMAVPLFRGGFAPVLLVVPAIFLAVGIMRWPIWWVLAVMVPVSIALAWWNERGRAA